MRSPAGRRRRGGWAPRLLLATVASLAAGLFPQTSAQALTLVANNDSYSVRHDRTLSVPEPGVLGNDTGIDLLGGSTAVYVSGSGPSWGFLTLFSDGSFTYKPVAGFVGQDTFRYRARDGLLWSLPATVTITVTNARPVAQDDWYTATTGVMKNVPAPGVLGNDSDADGDALLVDLVDGGGNGSLDLNADGSFSFKSGGSFEGDRTFTYRVSDGLVWSNTATVTIVVSAPGATPPPTPTPTPAPTPTPTPAPTPTPPLVLPTLPPIPTLPPGPSVLPELPSLPPVQVIPTTPPRSPQPGSTAAPSATLPVGSRDPSATSPPGDGGGSFLPGGNDGGAGGAGDPTGAQGGFGIPDDGFGTFDGFVDVELAGFDWAVPTLALSVPGLLLIIAVLAQGGAGILSVPFVRRSLGSFGLRRRREESAAR